MHDAHFHYSAEIVELQKEYAIPSICNAANLEEYQIVQENALLYSCGMHPWYADEEKLEELLPYIQKAPFVGEIGMDNVWCNVDLTIQKKVFEKQIRFAYSWHKPVILHTKGQEKEILEILQKNPNTYIVHWYSCEKYIAEYNSVASYFTVGPSVGKDDAVTKLVEMIPLEKLLLETDGIDAVEWAVGHRNYVEALQHSMHVIATIKNVSFEAVEQILDNNFQRLIG